MCASEALLKLSWDIEIDGCLLAFICRPLGAGRTQTLHASQYLTLFYFVHPTSATVQYRGLWQ